MLDVYLPSVNSSTIELGKSTKAPVLVLVSGGAWIIGYKFWSALTAKSFSRLGYLVIVPDYRNFPQGDIEDMCEDIHEALIWVVTNADKYGGDMRNIILAGQSAGAHISFCTLLAIYIRNLQHFSESSVGCSGKVNGILKSLSTSQLTQCMCGFKKPTENLATSSMGIRKRFSLFSRDSYHPRSQSWRSVRSASVDSFSIDAVDLNGSDSSSLKKTISFVEPEDQSASVTKSPDSHPGPPSSSPRLTSASADDSPEDSPAPDNVLQHIKLFVGISGPYNLVHVQTQMHGRGLDGSILQSVCRGDVEHYSPTHLVSRMLREEVSLTYCYDPSTKTTWSRPQGDDPASEAASTTPSDVDNGDLACLCMSEFPPVALFHGLRDATVPASISVDFAKVLRKAGVPTLLQVYDDWGHTDAILEGPLSGDDTLPRDIHKCVIDALYGVNPDSIADRNKTSKGDFGNVTVAEGSSGLSPGIPKVHGGGRMVPKLLIRLARFVNPF